MKKISIIVPLYNGDGYLLHIIEQAEKCAEVSGDYKIELVFSNDSPAAPILSDFTTDKIDIKVLNTNKNRGIHGARVRGFLNSSGAYILFLDQDDKIVPEFFQSQLESIGSADAVVCNAVVGNNVSGGRIKYNTDRPLYKAADRKSMVNEGCMILSPGQVLLCREAVPQSWIKNIMRNNGADDWFLWLCMHSEGKKFVINPEILFIREVHYHNTSFDTLKMAASEQEAVRIIEQECLLQEDERTVLRELLPKLQEKRIKENEKFKKMFMIQNDWLRAYNRGKSVADYLESRQIKKIAVYGCGYLGKTLLESLEKSDIEISYVIDKNADFLDVGKRCYTLGDTLGRVDAIIVTIMLNNREAANVQLNKKLDAKIFWLEDIIFDIAREE